MYMVLGCDPLMRKCFFTLYVAVCLLLWRCHLSDRYLLIKTIKHSKHKYHGSKTRYIPYCLHCVWLQRWRLCACVNCIWVCNEGSRQLWKLIARIVNYFIRETPVELLLLPNLVTALFIWVRSTFFCNVVIFSQWPLGFLSLCGWNLEATQGSVENEDYPCVSSGSSLWGFFRDHIYHILNEIVNRRRHLNKCGGYIVLRTRARGGSYLIDWFVCNDGCD